MRTPNPQIQKSKLNPRRIVINTSTLKHSLINLLKLVKQNLKQLEKKKRMNTYRGTNNRNVTLFRNCKTQDNGTAFLKCRGKNQPKILYPLKYSL